MIRVIQFVLLILLVNSASAQTITVISKEDKKTIPNVHIRYTHNGKEQTVLSDENGKVTLPDLRAAKITISCLGYETIEDLYNGENKIYNMVPKSITINDVVITAQYSPNSPEKSIHKIRIIDRKKIEAQGAQNLRDVLSTELNIRLSQDNILGSSMSLQGISGENVKIMIDGIPLIGRQNGNLDLSQINLNNIERIEIVEGPLSVNYGTNALAGVINLITKKEQQKQTELSLNTYYENIGQYNVSTRVGQKINKSFISINAGRNFFDGWNSGEKTTFIPEKTPADSSRYKQWKPKEQYFAGIQYTYSLTNWKLNYKFDVFDEKITNRGLPRAPYYETAFDDYYYTRRIDNAIFTNGKLDDHLFVNLMFAYNDYRRIKNTYYKDLTSLEEHMTENASDQDTSSFHLISSRGTIASSKPSSVLNFEAGYDISVEDAKGIRIKNTKQSMGDYAVFTSAEYKPVEQLIIRPGIRYAYNTSYQSPLLPSLNLKYSFNTNIALRASYARGFRAPSLKELYFYFVDINHNIVGSEDLKAESSHNFSLSATYTKVLSSAIYKIEPSAFYNDINNMITLALAEGTEYSYVNIGDYKTHGVQLNNELAYNHLKFSIGIACTGRYNKESESNNVSTYNYSPELRSSFLYEFKKQQLTIALFYKYTGELPTYIANEDNSIRETITEDYHTADMTVTKSFWKKRISVGVGSKNIFDVKNISSVSSGSAHSSGSGSTPVAMGRTYFTKIDFNLSR
jgi:outer membrane receptor for ferrienterochelin and colicins